MSYKEKPIYVFCGFSTLHTFLYGTTNSTNLQLDKYIKPYQRVKFVLKTLVLFDKILTQQFKKCSIFRDQSKEQYHIFTYNTQTTHH